MTSMPHITSFGFLFLPLALASFVLPPIRLAQLAVATSVFEAAAVAATPTFGVSPYFFVSILILIRLAFALVTRGGRIGRSAPLLSGIFLLIAFTAWACLGAVILPYVFEGYSVYSPRLGLDSQVDEGTPLHFTISNLAQVIYLVLNVGMVMFTAASASGIDQLRRLHRAFLWGGSLAILAAIYQKVSAVTGVPFPYDILQSNPSLNLRPGITFRGVTRLSGTFPEASNLALFGGAFLIYVWSCYLTHRRRAPLYLSLALLTALVLLWTTSTTAYLMLVIVPAVLYLRYILVPLFRGHFRWKAAGSVLLLLVTATLLVASSSRLQTVLVEAVLQKGDSTSLMVRATADRDALALFLKTFGVGVGLGSNRPSSFLTSLLSNVGIIGTVLFFGAVALLAYAASAVARTDPRIPPALWGLGIVLVGKLVSSPDLSTPILWVLIALCAAGASAVTRERGRSVRIGMLPTPQQGRERRTYAPSSRLGVGRSP